MDFPFTQFRATLFTTAHQIFDLISITMNALLLYLIVFQTSKTFRSYSIILASVTLSEFFLGLTAALAMTRLIPIENGIVLQFHGLCRKFTPQFCNDGVFNGKTTQNEVSVHTITLHCISYGYSLVPLSFWYRHYVLSNKAPSPKLIAFLCFLIYLPAFITMFPFASSTSDPAVARQMLIDHQNGSLFPDDPKIAAIIGYEYLYQKTIMPLMLWVCLPIFPGYTAAIIYRIRILRVLERNSMSPKTKTTQKKLVKALTLQAVLPLIMMSQASVYMWRQFKLPFAHSVPYFEEWVFLLVAIVRFNCNYWVSSINPCITIYYVAPYQEKVLKLFCWKRKSKTYKIHDHLHSNMSMKNTNDPQNEAISSAITSRNDLV